MADPIAPAMTLCPEEPHTIHTRLLEALSVEAQLIESQSLVQLPVAIPPDGPQPVEALPLEATQAEALPLYTSPDNGRHIDAQLTNLQLTEAQPAAAAAAAMFSPRFLVISLGNPAPYADTLHSAGHIALQGLQQAIGPYTQPAFSSARFGKKATQSSTGEKYTLLQSPTLMNVSGSWVSKAYRETLTSDGVAGSELGLVLVHDDLEEDLGVVKIRQWERSHRGHNGVKSVNGAGLRLADFKGTKWARISVGIGRPEGRDHATVSNFVLKPMGRHQRTVLTEKAGPGVLRALMELEQQWVKGLNGKGAREDKVKRT